MPKSQQVLKQMSSLKQYNTWTLSKFLPYLHGHVLEAGSGIGTFSKLLIPHVKHLTCIDINSKYVSALKDKYNSNSKVTIFRHNLINTASPLKAHSFDSIITLNVLEHIKDDGSVIKNFKLWLKSSGYLIILVPAHPQLFNSLDEELGHHRRYSISSLELLLKSNGFDPLKINYFNMLGLFGWFNSKTDLSTNLLNILDRIVPLLSFLEKRISPPFGLSIIAICKPK